MDEKIQKLLSSQNFIKKEKDNDNLISISNSDKTQNTTSEFDSETGKIKTRVRVVENKLEQLQHLLLLKQKIEEIESKIAEMTTFETDLDNIRQQISNLSDQVTKKDYDDKNSSINSFSNIDFKVIVRKLKDDIDGISKRINGIIDTNSAIMTRLITVESSNSEYISKLCNVESTTTNIQDTLMTSLENEINTLRSRLELVKNTNDSNVSNLKDLISSISSQYNILSSSVSANEIRNNDSLTSIFEKLSQFKKRIDDLPFQQQIMILTKSVSAITPLITQLSSQVTTVENDNNLNRETIGYLSGDFSSFKSDTNDLFDIIQLKIEKMKEQNDKLNSDFKVSSKFLTENLQKLLDLRNENSNENSNELDKVKNIINGFSEQMDNTNKSITIINNLISKMDEQNKLLSNSFKELNSKLIMSSTEQDSKISDILSRLEDFTSLQGKILNLMTEMDILNNRMTSSNTSFNNELNSLRTAITSSGNNTEQLNKRISENEKKTLGNNENIKDILSQISSINEGSRFMNIEINKLKTRVDESDNSKIKSDVDSLNKSNSLLISKINNIEDNQQKLSSAHVGLQDMLMELKLLFDNDTRNSQFKTEISNINNLLSNSNLKINDLENSNLNLSKRITSLESSPSVYQGLAETVKNLNQRVIEMLKKATDFQNNQNINENTIVQRISILEELVDKLFSTSSNDNSSRLIEILSKISDLQENSDNQNNSISQLNTQLNSINISDIEKKLEDLKNKLENNNQIDSNIVPTNSNSDIPVYKKTMEANIGQILTIPYKGGMPSRIKIMLDNIYEVPLSKTNGYLYSYIKDEIKILCGSESIGCSFNSTGKITEKLSGTYTISIYG